MGIGDWIDNVGGAIEHAVDDVETKAGSVIDRGAHTVADFARDHGAGGIADAIDEIGDQISNVLGGEIVEKELGQTKDKKELIHGEPSAIHDVVGKLKSMSASIESTGDALRTIDVADWTGKAATAFHTEFDKQPKAWFTAGDAFTKAAAHLDNWYWALETAQAKAQDAIDKWEAADKEEKSKKAAWNALSDKDKKSTPLVDTWTAMRNEARAILKNARSQRDNIASQVVSGLQAQTQEAPAEPPLSKRLSADFDDLKGVYDHGKLSFETGLLTSFSSIVQFARSTNILDPYNMSHPAEYFSSMADLGTGLVTAAADPGAVVDAMLSDARKNPFETGGAITGNIILTIATGGAGTAPKLAAETVEEATNAVRFTKVATDVVKDAPGAVPKGLPRVETPSLPGRGAPAVERPVEPSPGSGNPSAARPDAVHPGATSPQSPGAGVPKPDGAAPASVGVPENGPAAGPHPDGAAPQPHPADTHSGTVESGTSPGRADAPAHPGGDGAQPNPSADPRPVDAARDPSSAGPHADRPGQPGLATDPPGQPGLATERAPGDGTPAHQHLDADAPAAPRSDPNSPAPHSETPEPSHSTAAGDRQPAAEHDPAHGGDHNGTHPGEHDTQPEHAAPSHEHKPEPAPDGPHPTLEDRAGADQQAPDHARTGNPEDTSDFAHKTCTDDPVDIATGAFLLPQTDLELPGVLGLVLRRTHRSNYRFGRWFGPSWSATLDMRLVIDKDGVAFLGEDTVMLAFPHAGVGDEVEPVAGTREWTLTRTEFGGYQLWDPMRDLIFHFAPEPGLLGLDTRLGNFAISAITDRNHNRVRFHYNSDGIPTAVTHSGGYRVDIGTADGRITALTVVTEGEDRESHTLVREFSYESGNLVAVTNAVGATTRYTYDDSAQMLSWTDSNDNSMVNTYDEVGRVVRQRGSGGVLNCDLEYLDFPDGSGHLTTMTNSVGGVTTHGFDRDLRLRDIIDPSGGHTHTDYNAARKPLKVIAPDGATTSYAYTDTGEVAQITRPDGATIAVDYVLGNRPTVVTDADGSVRRQEWNENGDLAAVVDAGGRRREFAYHSNGAVAAVVAATGARTVVEVDPAGLPIAVTDPYGAITRIGRDGFGRPITVTDPLGAITRYEWSAQGKPLCRIDPDGHTESWVWDGEGNLLAHINRADGITTFTYGAFDLLESRTDPDGSTTRYTWDTERRLTTVTNALGQTWVYEYDPAGRLIAETDFNGATTRYSHDLAGRVATITSATGVTRRHRRDILGRTTEIVADTGEWLRYRHDPLGRVLTAISGDGEHSIHTLEFAYDLSGQLSSQQLDDQPAMQHAYDEYGRRIRRTLPNGATTTWQWNLADRVSALTADGHHIGFDYDALGRQTGWRIGELAITRTRSEVGNLISQSVTAFPGSSLNLESSSFARPAPQVIRHDSFTYRPDGYPVDHALARLDKTTEARHFALDPVGRVTAITENGDLTEAYAYDPLGNIIGDAAVRDNPPPAAGREYRGNLLIRDGRTRYSYDAAGRLIRKTTTRISRKPSVWTYRYNAFDQLVAVQTPDHRWWHYTYDAAGRRTSKVCRADDGTIIDRIDYTWDNTHLVEQTTSNSTLRWQYRPDSYAPIAQTDDQDTIDRAFYAIVTDLVGTPTDLINPDTGETIATATTDLWGQTSWRGGASTPLRFPGQIHDAETGLHYNLHRVYDPATGRFLTLDPLGLAPAPNPSLYPHNPTVWIDPLGLTPCEDYENLIEKLDDNTYFHYTNEETYHLIMSENGARFVANDVGKLFFTQEMLTPAEVEMNIFIGNPLYIGKGDFVIAFTKPEGAFFRPGEQPNEFIHQGGLKIPSGDVLYHGRNPF
ncbi:DUF6531 domain-containing protein [Nocardia sp. CDC153]|uniref:putative T7SS-secreted protein n=1 Tax=Nocardia sp. CDC153 TaxID=3112167 RepID=UPI002DB5A9C2|nr:DUF6531 domain-containing protein [Nocardia sp. CDC153]MEC3952905.1 DUF6531 domain-containing protein [Nocardia sp. CDC153]